MMDLKDKRLLDTILNGNTKIEINSNGSVIAQHTKTNKEALQQQANRISKALFRKQPHTQGGTTQ